MLLGKNRLGNKASQSLLLGGSNSPRIKCKEIAQAGGQTWDISSFVFLLSHEAPWTTWLLRPLIPSKAWAHSQGSGSGSGSNKYRARSTSSLTQKSVSSPPPPVSQRFMKAMNFCLSCQVSSGQFSFLDDWFVIHLTSSCLYGSDQGADSTKSCKLVSTITSNKISLFIKN